MTVTIPRRTQEDRTLASRAALVEAAARVLSTLGYAKSTTALICKEAGVTTGTLHHHFSTKEALLLAVLDAVRDTSIERFKALRDIDDGTSGALGNGARVHLGDRMIEALWPIYHDGRYWAVWEINMGFRSNNVMLEKIMAHRTHTNETLHEIVRSNAALSAASKAIIHRYLPFVQVSLRGIFLESFFRKDEFIQEQLDNFRAALRLLIDAKAAVTG